MKSTTKEATGTSFHNTSITATVNELISVLGKPAYSENSGEDKTNFEWDMETNNGDIFTVYDWKEYRSIDPNEPIEWHIGGINKEITEQAKKELEAALLPVAD